MKIRLPKTANTLLVASGALLILVATYILASPVDFYALNDIELGPNVNLLNEIKAPAGLLLAAGVYMVGAIFVRSQVDTALWLAALIYLSYALSRSASMVYDGIPATGLVHAAALEGIVGLSCLVAVVIRRMPMGKVA